MTAKAYPHKRKFMERRFIKRMKDEVGELPSDKIALCEQLAKEYNPITMNAGCFLYKLAYYSNDPEYYTSRGIYDPAEIERLISEHNKNNIVPCTKERIVSLFGESRWEEIVEARKQGMRDKGVVGYSKQATAFFDRVVETGIFGNYEYWYSKTHRGEFWVRDINNNDKYYFIDFCIPELKLAIEFHGYRYHPKHENDLDYERDRFGSMLPLKEKWEYDETKRNTIKARGYYYIEIWSDNVPSIDKFVEQLKEIIHERHKLVSSV